MRRYLKDYAKQCMDAYARNFGHPEIHDNHDLLWYVSIRFTTYFLEVFENIWDKIWRN